MDDPTEKSENAKVAKAAGIVGAATMVSRVLGVIRDMVIAAFFGASWTTDAFWVAFRIPNMLRRLLGEGSLTVSFVPVFTEYLQKNQAGSAGTGRQRLYDPFRHPGRGLRAGHSALARDCRTDCPGLHGQSRAIRARGFSEPPDVPLHLFIALVALCMGILNSFRHFTSPALSPVMLNIAMITAALVLHDAFDQPITALAAGVLAGGVLQLVMQRPALKNLACRFISGSTSTTRASGKSAP